MVLCYGIIAFEMLETIILAHFAVVIGVFFFGLAPLEVLRQYAFAMARFIIAIAAKLLVLELLVGVGQTILANFTASLSIKDFTTTITFSIVMIVFAGIVWSIPSKFERIIGSGGGDGMLKQAAGMAGRAAVSAASGGLG